MKKPVLLMFVLLGTSAIALAAACPVNLLSNGPYLGPPSSCTVLDKTFSDFTYVGTSSSPSIPPVPATGITVTPITTPNDPGLRFASGWFANAGEFQDSDFGYTVTAPANHPIVDASLFLEGSAVTGTGNASIAEDLCLGGSFSTSCPGGIVHLDTFNNSGGVKLDDNITFAPQTVISVFKDGMVDGGTAGTGAFSGVQNQFSETSAVIPEPGTLSMFGLSLISVAALMRRKLNF